MRISWTLKLYQNFKLCPTRTYLNRFFFFYILYNDALIGFYTLQIHILPYLVNLWIGLLKDSKTKEKHYNYKTVLSEVEICLKTKKGNIYLHNRHNSEQNQVVPQNNFILSGNLPQDKKATFNFMISGGSRQN